MKKVQSMVLTMLWYFAAGAVGIILALIATPGTDALTDWYLSNVTGWRQYVVGPTIFSVAVTMLALGSYHIYSRRKKSRCDDETDEVRDPATWIPPE